MGTIFFYIFLSWLTIGGIVAATKGEYWLIIGILIIWFYTICNKIRQEKKNRFKDWEMKKYHYNSISKKEQKEHYKEYQNERKNNKAVK